MSVKAKKKGVCDQNFHLERRSRTSEVDWEWNSRLGAPGAIHHAIENDYVFVFTRIGFPTRIDDNRNFGIVGLKIKAKRLRF